MAGDWIKMRVWIARDPKVIQMADWIAEQREFMDWLTDPVRHSCNVTAYEHVTRNVTTALCVTGLLVTWGTARERGDRILVRRTLTRDRRWPRVADAIYSRRLSAGSARSERSSRG